VPESITATSRIFSSPVFPATSVLDIE
jgi:hypothetical protein